VREIIRFDIFNGICQNNFGFDNEIIDKIEQNILKICDRGSDKVEVVLSQESASSKSVYQDAFEEELSISTVAQHGSAEDSNEPSHDENHEMSENSSIVVSDQTVIHCNLQDITLKTFEGEMSLNVEQTSFSQFDNRTVFTSTQNFNESPNIFCDQNACLNVSFDTPSTPTKLVTPQRQEADSSQNAHKSSSSNKNKKVKEKVDHIMKYVDEYGGLIINDIDVSNEIIEAN
jgi:hypothetical protein